jgi:hypothetical protein
MPAAINQVAPIDAAITSARSTMTRAEWIAEATRRFGSDPIGWRFICPSCSHVASVKDWRDAGASEGAVAFSCVGRYLDADGTMAFKLAGGPCNYAGGGLFKINPVTVIDDEGRKHTVFAFADVEQPHAP